MPKSLRICAVTAAATLGFALVLVGNARPLNAAECTVTPAGESVAMSPADINTMAPGGSIDASISTFSRGNDRYWIFPMVRLARGNAYVDHVFTKGTLDDIDHQTVGTWPEAELFGDAPGLKWITNTYDSPDGVLAFVHTEYALPGEHFGAKIIGKDGKQKTLPGPGHSRISLAWYPKPNPEQAAPKFQFLGHIIAPHRELEFEAWNVHGTPYVIRREGGEDWFYVYFFDAPGRGYQGHISTARAKVADVLGAAKQGKVTPWQKYDQGQWTSGLGGQSSPMTDEHTIAHSDAAQSADGRFYLATTFINNHKGSGKPSAIVVYDSCDAVNWREISRLKPITLPPRHANKRINHGWQYLTIVDGTGADNGRVGKELEMLVGYQHNKPERSVARLRYSLAGDCGCPGN